MCARLTPRKTQARPASPSSRALSKPPATDSRRSFLDAKLVLSFAFKGAWDKIQDISVFDMTFQWVTNGS